MIRILNLCNIVNDYLTLSLNNQIIKDFRIFLRKNENMYADILVDDKDASCLDEIKKHIIDITDSRCNIEILDANSLEEDTYYKAMFDMKGDGRIILDKGRRRYNNIWKSKGIAVSTCPIVSFYSYKGGMGRTTTLAAYASYLAIHHKKRLLLLIVILKLLVLRIFIY